MLPLANETNGATATDVRTNWETETRRGWTHSHIGLWLVHIQYAEGGGIHI